VLPTPRKFMVTHGAAEGPSALNAFDNALLQAGVGNVNLVRVSSILPASAIEVSKLEIPPGALLPIAYGSITSDAEGERIAAAVAVALGDPDEYGVIMEFSGRCSEQEAAQTVEDMARAAFATRGRPVRRVIVRAVEHRVRRVGCAFAAVALWY
jgi:arginine decarboxylase